MRKISPELKILSAACLTVGAVFTGAYGLTAVSLIATLAAVIVGVAAVAEVSRDAGKTVAVVGIAACTWTGLAAGFALTAPLVMPLGVVAVLAAVPVLAWIALWLTGRSSDGRAPSISPKPAERG